MNTIEVKDPAFFRLALANFMDSTDRKCEICSHNYVDVDDCIAKNVTLFKKTESKNYICCRKCYDDEKD